MFPTIAHYLPIFVVKVVDVGEEMVVSVVVVCSRVRERKPTDVQFFHYFLNQHSLHFCVGFGFYILNGHIKPKASQHHCKNE